MNQSISTTVAILLLATAVSCKQNTSYTPLDDRANFVEIKGERLFEDYDFIYPQGLVIAGNTLIVSDLNDKGMLTVMPLSGECNPVFLGSKGLGPGEFLNMRILDYNNADSLLYIHDTVVRKGFLYKYNPDSPELSLDNRTLEIDFSKNRIFDTHPVKNGVVSDVVSEPYMFAMVDYSGDIKSRFGLYPGNNDGMGNPVAFNMSHQTIMTTNGDDNIVVAGQFCDWIAFYHIDNEIVLTKEYYTFETPVETESNESCTSMRKCAETRDCFIELFKTKDYVYAAYRGSTSEERENNTALPTCVLKFTWDGTFVKGYNLAEPAFPMTVTEDNRYIIATAQGEDDNIIIKRFALPE